MSSHGGTCASTHLLSIAFCHLGVSGKLLPNCIRPKNTSNKENSVPKSAQLKKTLKVTQVPALLSPRLSNPAKPNILEIPASVSLRQGQSIQMCQL